MTDKEVIEILNDMKGVFGKRGHSQYALYAIDRAIEALEKQIKMEVEKMSMEDRFKKAIAEAERKMTKAIITKKLFDIRNGEFYKAHITEGNDFTIGFITLNGETTAYYTALIETLEEFNEGNFQLEPVGDDFKIIFDKQSLEKEIEL